MAAIVCARAVAAGRAVRLAARARPLEVVESGTAYFFSSSGFVIAERSAAST